LPKKNSIESIFVTNDRVIAAVEFIAAYFDEMKLTEEEAFTIGAHICGVSMESFISSGRISPEDIFHTTEKPKHQEKQQPTTALAKVEYRLGKKIHWGSNKSIPDNDDYS
jgi:hypothetical protein